MTTDAESSRSRFSRLACHPLVAIRLARKRIQLAHIIAWSLWRRAHQASAQRAHFKARRQTVMLVLRERANTIVPSHWRLRRYRNVAANVGSWELTSSKVKALPSMEPAA